jgi:hypothetical protein
MKILLDTRFALREVWHDKTHKLFYYACILNKYWAG